MDPTPGRMTRPVKFHGFTVPKGAKVIITGYDDVVHQRWDSAAWDYVDYTRHNASIIWNDQSLGVSRSSVREVR